MIYVKDDRLIINQQHEINIPFNEISYLRVRNTADYKLNYFIAAIGVACALSFLFIINNVLMLIIGLSLIVVSMFFKKEAATLHIVTHQKEKICAAIRPQDVVEVKKIVITHQQYNRRLDLKNYSSQII